MDLSKLSVGINPPHDLNVVIEIPQGAAQPVKYEFDKVSGALLVDRFLHTAMYYQANYGFVPHTLSTDGDPIGALLLEDEHGGDEKIVAVPVDALHPFYSDVCEPDDLPQILRDQIAHFFQHYKDLEQGKWVTVGRWVGSEQARGLIRQALARVGTMPSC